jgi:hypothetical protein
VLKLFFDDTEFDAQFARTVGKSVVGAADVGSPWSVRLMLVSASLRPAG